MPSRRLLVMAAGTGACNNLVRSLRAGAAGVYIVGCNDDRFTLKQSSADSLYLTPPVTAAEFESALLRLLDQEKVELVIPSGDGDVLALVAFLIAASALYGLAVVSTWTPPAPQPTAGRFMCDVREVGPGTFDGVCGDRLCCEERQ